MSHNTLKITPGKPNLLRHGLAIASGITPFRTEKRSIDSRLSHVCLVRSRNQATERNEVQKRKGVGVRTRNICLQVKWTLCFFNCLAFDCMRT